MVLQIPQISTLSFGLTEKAHFDEMRGIFPTSVPLSPAELAIQQRMDNAVYAGSTGLYEGWEFKRGDPSGINIPEVLRHRRMATCYGQEAFGHYRYNMFQEKGDWPPAALPRRPGGCGRCEQHSQLNFPLKELLSETHQRFYQPKDQA